MKEDIAKINYANPRKYCPYCEIKEQAKIKTLYESLKLREGRCKSCGANLDIGQRKVFVNGYKAMYDGILEVIGEVVDQFKEILAYADIDLTDYYDSESDLDIVINPDDIIDRVFTPHYGQTTRNNVRNALKISDDNVRMSVLKGVENE